VWQAFQYLFTEPPAEISEQDQQQMLEHALERVTVGVDLGEVRYRWRDAP
jgi:hypothetical protein